jgi:transposase
MQNKNNTTNKQYTKKIKNWSEYNRALVNRGNISVYISEALAKKVFIHPCHKGKVGHPVVYQDAFIELILTLRELTHLPLRQTIGFVTGLLQNMGINWQLPDYSTLSRRMGSLHLDFCHNFRSKNVVLLLDSSGFKVFGEGEWKVRKHGIGYHRTWRETHIAVDFKTRDIIGLVNTKPSVHDNTQFVPLLNQVLDRHGRHNIQTIIGDGAYDAKANYLTARKLGVDFIAPPPKNAAEHLNMYHYQPYDKPGWEERNAAIRQIEEYGLDGWKADVDYHRRSLVENTFYRLKTIFGANLKSRKEATQYTEQCIRAGIINRFNKMGLPQYMVAR